jgi:long-chain fatty acid transport protein
MVIDFHPTFSYKFNDKFSAGIGLSLDYAAIELTKLEMHESYGPYLPTYFQMEGTGFTYGANFGLMYKPTNCLSLGLSGRLSSELKFDGSADIDVHLNDVIAGVLGMPDANVQNANPDAEATIILPADIGAGVGYKINENWLVAADFTYTMWDAVDVINIEFENGATLMGSELEDKEMILNWENTLRFGMGTEFLMNQWAFRTGYYYDESPLVDETMGITFPDFSTKHALNFGCGYMINKNLCLDLGLEYIMFEEREVTEDTEENWTGTYNAGLIDVMLDLTWKF